MTWAARSMGGGRVSMPRGGINGSTDLRRTVEWPCGHELDSTSLFADELASRDCPICARRERQREREQSRGTIPYPHAPSRMRPLQ